MDKKFACHIKKRVQPARVLENGEIKENNLTNEAEIKERQKKTA
jgi:hypothetical protein